MCEENDAIVERLVNVVVANRDVFGARMECSVLDEFNRGAIVAVDGDWVVEDVWRVQLG